MPAPTALEFLLVSTDYKTLSAVNGGLKQCGAVLDFVPTTDSALQFIGRRRIDGIFVDLAVSGALDLILSVREGSSNRHAVIFACAHSATEAAPALGAGANFVVHEPITAGSVRAHVTASRNVMVRERRRYFRHAVSLPVSLTVHAIEHRATITNISEGGMAVRVTRPLEAGSILSVIDFAFELDSGPTVSGRGQITWANNEGLMGVTFHFLRGKGQDDLLTWFSERQGVLPKPPFAADDLS
jgi:hypothetical protein